MASRQQLMESMSAVQREINRVRAMLARVCRQIERSTTNFQRAINGKSAAWLQSTRGQRLSTEFEVAQYDLWAEKQELDSELAELMGELAEYRRRIQELRR